MILSFDLDQLNLIQFIFVLIPTGNDKQPGGKSNLGQHIEGSEGVSGAEKYEDPFLKG